MQSSKAQKIVYSLTSKRKFLSYRVEFGESDEWGLFKRKSKKDSKNKISAHKQSETLLFLLKV